MADTATTEIKNMSFEQALAELEQIVKELESGSIPLEDSINAYTRGAALKKHCETKLADARMRVEKIALDADGKPSVEAFDPAS